MDTLRVSTIQSDLKWEDIDANLAAFSPKILALKDKTDIIILPEMFSTGFTNNCATLAEAPTGKTFQWMYKHATDVGAVITGSFIIKEDNKYYNRLIWMQPNGKFGLYNKRYLFTKAKEHEFYERGTKRVLVEWKGWKICPLICYDLRFPMWARNNIGYDLLLYTASWPATRANHWKTLLQARAIENQAYTIGVNRVGTDGNDFSYAGHTSIIDYSGDIIYQTAHVEDVFTVALNYDDQEAYRTQLAFLQDQEGYEGKNDGSPKSDS